MHEDVTPSRLLGYHSPINGDWVKGELEEVLTEGGVAILDEVDRSRPGVTVALNAVLAQRKFTLKGETKPIHDEARFLCWTPRRSQSFRCSRRRSPAAGARPTAITFSGTRCLREWNSQAG